MATTFDRIRRGSLVELELDAIVKEYQRTTWKLKPDGDAGEKTQLSLHDELWVSPAGLLLTGHKPKISSEHKTVDTDRDDHEGVDIMFSTNGLPKSVLERLILEKRATRKWWVPANAPTFAFADGQVRSMALKSNGWRIYVRHADGLDTGYRHLGLPVVREGEHVRAGQLLAVELSSLISPRHWHFEIRQGRYGYRDSLDPTPWLLRSRLLLTQCMPYNLRRNP